MHGGRMLLVLSLVLTIFQGLLVVKATLTGSYALIQSCSSVSTMTPLSDCTFETDNCGFTQQMTMGWRRNHDKFQGGFFGLFKKSDHTTGNGYFLAPETDNSEVPKNALAELVLSPITAPSLCLDFWYTSQDSRANIKVLLECESGTRHTLFTMATINTGDWKEMAISIEYPEPYKIIFQTTKKMTAKTLCLDDIRVYKTRPSKTLSYQNLMCNAGGILRVTGKSHASSIPTASSNVIASGQTNINCSFENGSCGWQQGSEDNFDWQIGSVSKARGISVPRSDHTTGDGHYAFIDGREVLHLNWTARLTSHPIMSDSDLVFKFWYHMNGIGIGSLTLYKNNLDGEEETLWCKIGRQGPGWKNATIQIGNGRFKLAFVATVKYHYDSDLAIDDTSLANATKSTTAISTTITTTTTPVQLPVLCDFGEDLCGIQIVPNVYNTVTWEQKKEPLIYQHTVYIDGDNSTGNGTYMSLKLLNGHPQNGDKAVLRLPQMQSATRTCLTFAYILPGINSGTIVVYRKSLTNGKLELVMELSGYKGTEWKKLSVDLKKSDVFQIFIEGSYTGEPASFIGIDDLSVVPGLCPDLITTTQTPTTTTTAPPVYWQVVKSCATENVSKIPAISCTFDTSLCGYQIREGQMKWARKTGQYDGISRSNKESYLAVNTKTAMMVKNVFAQVESSLIDTRNVCVEFSYIMPETHSNLELWLHFTGGQKELIWNQSGNHGDNWKEAALTLNIEYDGRFQIVFRSSKKGYLGLVGVDNIVGYNLIKDNIYTAAYSSSQTQTSTHSAQSHISYTLENLSSKAPAMSTFLASKPIKVTSRLPHIVTYASTTPSLSFITSSTLWSSEKPATTTSKVFDSTSKPKVTSSSPTITTKNIYVGSSYSSKSTLYQKGTSNNYKPSSHSAMGSGKFSFAGHSGSSTFSLAVDLLTAVTPNLTTIKSKSESTTYTLLTSILSVPKPTKNSTGDPLGNIVKHGRVHVSHYDNSKGDHYKGAVIGVIVSVFTFCVLIMVVFIFKKRVIKLEFHRIKPNNFQMQASPKSSKDMQTKNETNIP